jgi:toxin-antitoxin system PIN domain toxin
MFVVDTNVLVYAADEDSPHHARCLERLNAWRSQADAWFVTWGILYEFLRITTHPRVMRKPWTAPKAWAFVAALLDSPGLEVLVPTERHAAVAARVIEEIPHLAGNLVHDACTAVLMREHGIRRIYTRDTDFHRFAFVEPMDPLEPTPREPGSGYAARRGRRRSRA